VKEITEPGTITDLVADALADGYRANVRLIRDWTQAGLLDYPQKRPAGKGHGSSPALYPATQRMLFLTLLHHRPGNGISSIARIPVGIWMYWGDQYVPVRQVRRAINTWVGDPRVSMRRAKETAREILRQLDNPRATTAARRELLAALTHVAYTARPDYNRLEHTIRDVFEPGSAQIRKAIGHPAAPLTADSIIELVKARLTAVRLLATDQVDDGAFNRARQVHLMAYAEYAIQVPILTTATPAQNPAMYEPVTAEAALNSCCGHLLTAIGMAAMHPDRAAQLNAAASQGGEQSARRAAQVNLSAAPQRARL
jgi:hypothetical protein